MAKRHWLLGLVTAMALTTALVATPRLAMADDDDQVVGVAEDADGDGVPDVQEKPDGRTTRKTWGQLAQCGISRGSAAMVGGWWVVAAAAFTCLMD